MTNVIHLPYVEPQHQVTAQSRPSNLEEHLTAFLASNNRNGFKTEEELPPGPFKEFIQELSRKRRISEKEFKRKARALRAIGRRKVGLCRIQEACAAAFGYKTYNDMFHTGKMRDTKTGQWYYINKTEN